MSKRKWITALAAGAALICAAGAANARTAVSVQIGVPVYALAPAPVVVYQPVAVRVWVPGHWEWQGNGHAWIPGHYRAGSHPYAYHDRDGDGVPDRFDRAPFNPYRY